MIHKLMGTRDLASNIKTITDEVYMENIRVNLERIRTEHTNLSQDNFAKEIGLSPSHYKRLIRGEASLGAACTFKTLYLKYGVTLHELGMVWDRALRIRSKLSLLDDEQLGYIEHIVDREISRSKKAEE